MDFEEDGFGGAQLAFQRVPGVVATCVGYSQGETQEPTYEDVCTGQTGHAEVVQARTPPLTPPMVTEAVRNFV